MLSWCRILFWNAKRVADASITNVFGSSIIQVYVIDSEFAGPLDPFTITLMVEHSEWIAGRYIRFTLHVHSNCMKYLFVIWRLISNMTVVVVVILVLRRYYAGGELGGPNRIKIPTTIGFISLWLTFESRQLFKIIFFLVIQTKHANFMAGYFVFAFFQKYFVINVCDNDSLSTHINIYF